MQLKNCDIIIMEIRDCLHSRSVGVAINVEKIQAEMDRWWSCM